LAREEVQVEDCRGMDDRLVVRSVEVLDRSVVVIREMETVSRRPIHFGEAWDDRLGTFSISWGSSRRTLQLQL